MAQFIRKNLCHSDRKSVGILEGVGMRQYRLSLCVLMTDPLVIKIFLTSTIEIIWIPGTTTTTRCSECSRMSPVSSPMSIITIIPVIGHKQGEERFFWNVSEQKG